MPDGNQRPFNYQSPQPQADAFNMPGATRPAGGVDRIIALVRMLTLSSVGLAVIVFGFQAVMPAGSKPSDLIGSFHGATETAELKAKQEATAEYERKLADAKAAPVANWEMEKVLAQAQQEAVKKSLAMQEEAANLADLACFGSALVPFFSDTRDARDLQKGMEQGCGAAARIRDNIVREQAKAALQGSGLVQRSAPGTGAGSAPAIPVPAQRR